MIFKLIFDRSELQQQRDSSESHAEFCLHWDLTESPGMNQDSTGALHSLKAKHSAVMFDYLGDLKDDFLLHSKQKTTFHVDSNSHNTVFKTKQPQNPIDCTQDGNPSKLEAACWHFSQGKEKGKKVHTDLLYLSQISEALGFIHSARGRHRLGVAVHEHEAPGVCFPE